MTRRPPLCVWVCACECVCQYVSGNTVAQPCCTQLCCADPSAVCNSVFIIFSLYMIILILIDNIHCIFVIIYMHYQVSNHSLTELVWWFWFILFSELFCYKTKTWSQSTSVLANLKCLVWYSSQKHLYGLKQQHLTRGGEEAFCFLSLVPGGWWRLDIYCSILCTVTGHCTALGIFAEIYNIVSNVFFQCFPHNIW